MILITWFGLCDIKRLAVALWIHIKHGQSKVEMSHVMERLTEAHERVRAGVVVEVG